MTQCGLFDEPSGAQAFAGEYDRPAKMRHQSRSAVIASHGMVATSQPLAAQVGLDILRAGGTAADAAIATCAMMGLVEPMDCGLGGDLFAIYWDNKTQKLYGLNASGRSPYALNREVFRSRGLVEIPEEGVFPGRFPAASTVGTSCVSGSEKCRSSSCWPPRFNMPKRAFRSPRSSPVSGRPKKKGP